MENTLFRSAKNWYLILILGIVMVLVGIWVFSTPVLSYAALSLLFASAFIVTGILEISFALSNTKEMENWGWSLVGGIIDLLIGIFLFTMPLSAMLFLAYFVGFGILFKSATAIGHSITLKKLGIKDWGWLLFVGIMGMLFSFILIWNPAFAGLTVVFYTGMAFVMLGIFQITISFKLRKLKKMLS